jgi:DNA-binding transcriptional regulator YhcF (GntR family)
MNPELDINRPLFLQVKEAIIGDILTGNLQPDEQIPSNSQLVSFFSLNPVTVHKGVSQLLDDGIIYKKRGLGMFVQPNARELLRAKGQEMFAADHITPLVKQAKTLGMTAADVCAQINKIWQGEENDHE